LKFVLYLYNVVVVVVGIATVISIVEMLLIDGLHIVCNKKKFGGIDK
jgi:hypothetical protein